MQLSIRLFTSCIFYVIFMRPIKTAREAEALENNGLDELRVTAFNHLKVTAGIVRFIALCNIAFGVFTALLVIATWQRVGLGVVVFWLLWRVVSSLGGMIAEAARRSQYLALRDAGVKRFIVVQAARESYATVEYADGARSHSLDPQVAQIMEGLGYGKIYRLPSRLSLPLRCSIARGAAFLHCRLGLRLSPPMDTELAEIVEYLWTLKGSFDLKEELAACARRAIQRHMQGCESVKRFDLTRHALDIKPPVALATPLPYSLAKVGQVRVEVVRTNTRAQTRR